MSTKQRGDKMEEQTYDEVDYTLTIKRKDGREVKESEFNKVAKHIEELFGHDHDYLVLVQKLDPDEYEIERD